MKRELAGRSVGITKLKHSPSAVLEKAGSEADLREAVQEGIDSGPAIPAGQVFAELKRRFADSVTPGKKRKPRA